MFKTYILVIGFGIVSGCSNQAYSQCDELLSNYSSYLLKHTLTLDPIEGIWDASRTIKVYHKDQLKRTKTEHSAEQWIITRQGGQFVVCNNNNEKHNVTMHFVRTWENRYTFSKNYILQNATVSAFSVLADHRLRFSFTENDHYLKLLLKHTYSPTIRIEYEYELEKVMTYTATVTEQIPRIKNFIIDNIINFFNRQSP